TFALPFTRFTDLDDLMGFTLVALSPTGDRSLDDIDADRVAIVLGAEGQGLRATTLAACDVRARIPMREGVDSLGVASAAAIAFHHLGRVRKAGR
ncbi:MAG TPA: TrmH family RNA methyltransferase, partial [Acidimicrobiales bacterium]|nr:TrmH family RNA methyltransferase [Acidimicrobiales bacterium]